MRGLIEKGFTLLEVLVVLAIFSVLLGLGIPAWTTHSLAPRLAAEEFSQTLRTARQHAVTHNRPTRLVLSTEHNAYRIYEFHIPENTVGFWRPVSDWCSVDKTAVCSACGRSCSEEELADFYPVPTQTYDPHQSQPEDFFDSSYAGSPYPSNYLQTPADGADSNFLNLPGIEFSSQGQPFTHADFETVSFMERNQTNNRVQVRLDLETGEVQMEQP